MKTSVSTMSGGRLSIRAQLSGFGALAIVACVLVLTMLSRNMDWMAVFPEEWHLPVTGLLNRLMEFFVAHFTGFFRQFSALVQIPLDLIDRLLITLPWPITATVFVGAALFAGGPRLAVFTAASLAYILLGGYWEPSMHTLALVFISVPAATLLGFLLAMIAMLSPMVERTVRLTLDLLQTIPAFAYLIPILMLFGFGPVVGLLASVLFAAPTMARNAIDGLKGVDPQIIEAGLMAGATPRQLFWRVRFGSAAPQLMLGVNQTTMSSLNMVIISALVGGTQDIGWEVLNTMRKAQFGESLLLGIVIALIAINMDRITAAFAARNKAGRNALIPAKKYAAIAALVLLACVALAWSFPPIQSHQLSWAASVADYLNDALTYIVVRFGDTISSIKITLLFYLMLPLKIGLQQAVSPMTWGFALTPPMVIFYTALIAGGAVLLLVIGKVRLAAAFLLFGIVAYFGLVNIPWVAWCVVLVTLAFHLRGRSFAVATLLMLAFLLVAGVWDRAVLSFHLCAIAVSIAFGTGSLIGIWAATNDRVSAIVRPVIDTLQTMPLFVLLIPVVMVFKIGDVTALLAIISFAIVPAVRYTEHALRHVPNTVVEAGMVMGCTPVQMIWRIKLPVAAKGMMLGLNQTIMFALAMLVITSLVGANELGQLVYIGLGNGDFGVGMVAGLGMSFIAIIADRLTQFDQTRPQNQIHTAT